MCCERKAHILLHCIALHCRGCQCITYLPACDVVFPLFNFLLSPPWLFQSLCLMANLRPRIFTRILDFKIQIPPDILNLTRNSDFAQFEFGKTLPLVTFDSLFFNTIVSNSEAHFFHIRYLNGPSHCILYERHAAYFDRSLGLFAIVAR